MRQGVFGRERIRRILFVFLAAFFCQIGLHEVYEEGKSERLHANTVQTAAFRRQYVTEEMESYIQKAEDPGRDLGIYWLETKFGYETFPWQISGETFQEREKRWKRKERSLSRKKKRPSCNISSTRYTKLTSRTNRLRQWRASFPSSVCLSPYKWQARRGMITTVVAVLWHVTSDRTT